MHINGVCMDIYNGIYMYVYNGICMYIYREERTQYDITVGLSFMGLSHIRDCLLWD